MVMSGNFVLIDSHLYESKSGKQYSKLVFSSDGQVLSVLSDKDSYLNHDIYPLYAEYQVFLDYIPQYNRFKLFDITCL